MLEPDRSVLLIVDLQEKLAPAIHDGDALVGRIAMLAAGADILELPVLLTEQNPAGLGPTVAPIAQAVRAAPIQKREFSCWARPEFREALARLGRNQVLLAGIETHVCIYQTARDLLSGDFEVHVVADATGSRNPDHARIALDRMVEDGARRTCVEMALLELQATSQGERFKQLLGLIK